MGIDRISELCGVHRATAARWLAAARQETLAEVWRLLGENLQLSEPELRSAYRVVRSQIDLSLSRILSDETGAS